MDSKTSSETVQIITIDVHEAKNRLDNGHTYLDVRNEEDFKKVHAENALNVPYYVEGKVKNPDFVDQVKALFGKDDHLIVACFTGGRSKLATTDLVGAELHACNMGGGLKAWIGEGFPVTKPQDDDESDGNKI